MNHYTWTHIAGAGRNTNVGLYHGGKAGHVLIYVGKKIVTIDFNVFDSKEYTFFIDEEFCRIKLERRGEEMFYFFEIDKKVDTPLNRVRWAREKKYLWQMLIAIAIGGALVTAILMWSKTQGRNDDAERRLSREGVETFGKIAFDTSITDPEITFYFISGNENKTGKADWKSLSLSISSNQMPLQPGDEFVVKYVPSRPSLNRIYIARPTDSQVNIYKTRAVEKHLALHPNLDKEAARCLVELAFELDGLSGLADFYFQNTAPSPSQKHNTASYQRLVNSYLYKGKAKNRCPVK